MTVAGHIQNGVVVLDLPTSLPDGTAVRVEILEGTDATKPDSPRCTLFKRFQPIIGIAPDFPPDASINHDHYLYGTPKRS